MLCGPDEELWLDAIDVASERVYLAIAVDCDRPSLELMAKSALTGESGRRPTPWRGRAWRPKLSVDQPWNHWFFVMVDRPSSRRVATLLRLLPAAIFLIAYGADAPNVAGRECSLPAVGSAV